MARRHACSDELHGRQVAHRARARPRPRCPGSRCPGCSRGGEAGLDEPRLPMVRRAALNRDSLSRGETAMAVDIKQLFNETLPAALSRNAEDAKTIGAKYQMN